METSPSFPRSPELMSPADTALLVVDVQEKLIPLTPGYRRLVWNMERLLRGAKILQVATAATEQYPKGLGKTTPALAQHFGELPAKTMFSCRECAGIFADYRARGIFKWLVVGIETHVCIQQTVLDLLSAGLRVYVAADAVGARHAVDHEYGLRRMESAGATLTTAEAALFEWCEAAGSPEFKQISAMVREQPPE